MDYLIISAATVGSRYVECLATHEQMHGKQFKGFILSDRGSWAANTKLKPEAIRMGFRLNNVVLWVDADCTVTPPSELPEGDWDICTTENFHPEHKIKTSAGFILFRNTPNTALFLRHWDGMNRTCNKDHPAMMHALRRMAKTLKVCDMTEWLRGNHHINNLAPERGSHAG